MGENEKKFKRKKRLGSYPITNVVVSISLALFFVGLFGTLYIHSHQLKQSIQNNLEVQVYLKKGIQNNERIKLQRTINDKAYIGQKDSSPRVSFLSREEAAEKFIKDTGEDFVKFLGDNPLRDAILINVKPEYQTPEALKSIKKELESYQSVFEVTYVESLIESINSNLKVLSFVLIGVALLLFITVVILIHNTIKLALFSQRFLIRSMQLIGATASFIQRPFLYRSIVYGIIAGLVSSLILFGLTNFAYNKIADLRAYFDYQQALVLFGIVLGLGIMVSFFSTYFAIRKYLKLSLDELY